MHSRASELFLVAVVAGLVALSAVSLYPFSRAAETRRNVELARQHAERHQPRLRQDARFGLVRLTALAKDGGVLLCSGSVETDDDLRALRISVLSTRPPVPVQWDVTVRTLPASRPDSSM